MTAMSFASGSARDAGMARALPKVERRALESQRCRRSVREKLLVVLAAPDPFPSAVRVARATVLCTRRSGSIGQEVFRLLDRRRPELRVAGQCVVQGG